MASNQPPPHPPAVPLTDVMEFTGRDGTSWLAYVEAVPPPTRHRWRHTTLMPARRLRFDSASEARTITPVPAGAPFLTETRLQGLLDRAAPLEPSAPAARGGPERGNLQPAARVARIGAGVFAAAVVAEGGRRWRTGVERRRSLRSRTVELVAGAADRLVLWAAALLRGRPRARL